MKSIEQKIAVMQHCAAGGMITMDGRRLPGHTEFNWVDHDYDIYVEPRKTVKMWPVLYRHLNSYYIGMLFADEAEAKRIYGTNFVRLLTEYPAIEVEV